MKAKFRESNSLVKGASDPFFAPITEDDDPEIGKTCRRCQPTATIPTSIKRA